MTGNELTYIAKVLESGFVNDGPQSAKLESVFCQIFNVGYATAVTNCTSGLFLALKAMQIGCGHEVIVPNLTFIATANAVRLAGAEPVLVDVLPTDFTINPADIRRKLTHRTRAIIAVDVNGRPAHYKEISDTLPSENIRIVADLAEANGQKSEHNLWRDYASCGVISLSPNKTITSGQGGMVLTNSPSLHEVLRALKDQGRPTRGSGGDDLHPFVGYNFKYTDIQAAFALAQIEDLPQRVDHAVDRWNWYAETLESTSSVVLPSTPTGAFTQWQDAIARKPETFANALRSQEIGYRRFWKPLHTQFPYLQSNEQFPVSSQISYHGFWLPSSYDLAKDDVLTLRSLIEPFVDNS